MPWRFSSDPTITARAVERQMRNWELARSQRRDEGALPRAAVEDFVTVSREVGLPGEEVARLLGERLGWPVFGRNLLDAMAGDDGVRYRIYEQLDQRDLKWWQEALYGLFGEGFVRNDYFRLLCETVLSLARQGCCVFVGRGCDRLLPDDLGFRVRLVAQRGVRLDRLCREHHLTAREAESLEARTERERRDFLLHHFKVEASDPSRHDLTLNLGRMNAVEAVDVILAARDIRFAARAAPTVEV